MKDFLPIYEQRPEDTEDRDKWYEWSESVERFFCENRAGMYGLMARINPQKVTDKIAIDLDVTYQNGVSVLTELKPQFVPFYMAESLFEIDPSYAFSVNVSDIMEYSMESQAFRTRRVLYWIEWMERNRTINGKSFNVTVVNGLWESSVNDLIKLCSPLIKSGNVHEYSRRRTDMRTNSLRSCVFDIRNFKQITLVNQVQNLF